MILPVPLQYKGVTGSIPTPSEYLGDTRWSSAREIFRGKPLSVALYALAAAGFVGWSSGWLSSPTKVSGPEAPSAAYQQSLQKLSRVLRPHTELSAAWLPGRKRPSSGAVTPFSTFTCFGDENAVDIIYSKPFRFHVYSDMPSSMYNNTVFRAVRFWEPNHSNNQFETEARLVDDLTLHPCHTIDPEEADAFIVPVQTISTIWLQEEAGEKDGGRAAFGRVVEWLEKKPTYLRNRGRDHYAMGIPWDRTRRPFGEMNLFGPETPTNYKNMGSFEIGKYMHALHDIVIPYPDPDSVAYYTEERLASIERTKLAIFIGSMIKQSPIREKVAKQMRDYNKDNGAELAVWKYIDHNTATDVLKEALPTSVFGPVMEGDSFSSRRLFSLIFAGTIPVIVCDRLMLPFEDLLDYSSFVVFVSEQDVLEVSDFNLFELLASIPEQDVRRLQENGRKVRKHFTFHRGDVVPGDAFDMFVRTLASVSFNGRRLRHMIRRSTDSSMPNAKLAVPSA